MRTRLALGVVGVAMGAFGALRFLQLDLPDIVDAVLWLAGGVVIHDGIIAPLTIALTVLATRVVPPGARTRVTVAPDRAGDGDRDRHPGARQVRCATGQPDDPAAQLPPRLAGRSLPSWSWSPCWPVRSGGWSAAGASPTRMSEAVMGTICG